jgi:ribose 5-phosphate isomerase RpiB
MKIAVINETSAADRNADILAALDERGHEVFNVGMKNNFEKPELTYLHTGFLAGLLLNTGRIDFVVGGCGTGQGFLNSVMQYPNVCCGLIASPLEAWLFSQINGGNAISLALNYGYGWAGDINLKFIFDKLFSVEFGIGYPPHRKESQQESRRRLSQVSRATHLSLDKIISALDDEIVLPALNYPGIMELLDVHNLDDKKLAESISKRIG